MQLICVMIIHVTPRPGNVGENLMATGTTQDMNAVVIRDLKTVETAKHV